MLYAINRLTWEVIVLEVPDFSPIKVESHFQALVHSRIDLRGLCWNAWWSTSAGLLAQVASIVCSIFMIDVCTSWQLKAVQTDGGVSNGLLI